MYYVYTKNRRKYVPALKLLNYRIDCPSILERVNFEININNSRNNDIFFILSIKSNYSLLSSAIVLMSFGNSAGVDLFACNIIAI